MCHVKLSSTEVSLCDNVHINTYIHGRKTDKMVKQLSVSPVGT